jgi:hypothetical protein
VDHKAPNPETIYKETQQQQRPIHRWSITQRQFVATAGILTGGAVMGFPHSRQRSHSDRSRTARRRCAIPLQPTINGKQQQLTLDPRTYAP